MDNNKNLLKNDLLLYIQRTLVSSGFLIYSLTQCKDDLKSFYKIDIKKNDNQYTLFINVSNINSAFLPNKPYIKRRQVGKLNMDLIPQNKNNSLSMLLGITFVDETPIYVCWNPFYFTGHEKNRSCYVLDSSILYAYNNSYYFGEDCKTPVFVFNELSFEKMLQNYIDKNMVD